MSTNKRFKSKVPEKKRDTKILEKRKQRDEDDSNNLSDLSGEDENQYEPMSKLKDSSSKKNKNDDLPDLHFEEPGQDKDGNSMFDLTSKKRVIVKTFFQL